MSYSGSAVDYSQLTDWNNTLEGNSTVTVWNDTVHIGGLDFAGITQNYMSLVARIFEFLKVCLAVASIAINALAFTATNQVSEKSLKPKMLIQNAILADIAFGIATSLRPLAFLLRIFGLSSNTYGVIYNNLRTLGSAVGYSHLVAAILLVVDRIYAVFKPLTYYTVGYNTLSKVLLLTVCWLGGVLLALPGIIIAFVDEKVANSPLDVKLQYGYLQYNRDVMNVGAIATNLLIFAMYMVMFFALQLQRSSNRALAESQSVRRKTSLSLTITYFLIHFSSLCFFIPGPLFRQVRDTITTLTGDTKTVIYQTLLSLYVLNSLLNPIILVARINNIRQKFRLILKLRFSRNNKDSSGTKSADVPS